MVYGTFGSGPTNVLARPALVSAGIKIACICAMLWVCGIVEMTSPQVETLLRAEKHSPADVSSIESIESLFHSYGWKTTTSTYFTLHSDMTDEQLMLSSNVDVPTFSKAACFTSMDMSASLVFLNDVFESNALSNASNIIVAPLSDTEAINCDVMAKAYQYNYAGVIFHTENPSYQTRICSDLNAGLDITPGYPFVKGAPRLSINAARQRFSLPPYVSLIDQVVVNDLRDSGSVHISRACQNTIHAAKVVVGHLDGKYNERSVLLGAYDDTEASLIAVLHDLHAQRAKGWVPEKAIDIAFWKTAHAATEWFQDTSNLQTIDSAIHVAHHDIATLHNTSTVPTIPLYLVDTSKETLALVMRLTGDTNN